MSNNKVLVYLDGEKRSKLNFLFNYACKKYGVAYSEEAVIFIWSNMIISDDISKSDYDWFYKENQTILNQHGYYYNPESK